MDTQALERAFRDTAYRVFAPHETIDIRIDVHNDVLNTLVDEHMAREWAFITAWNPGAVIGEDHDNLARNAALAARLATLNHRWFPGEGVGLHGTWPAEPGFLVLGIPRDAAIALAGEFGQLAIVAGYADGVPELVWVRR